MAGTSRQTKVNSVSRKPLSEQVYETLKGAMLSGDIRPGDRLNETDIAAQLDVSKTPVREALRRLEAEEYVTIAPWRGVIVCEFARKQILEIYQCREALEGLAARLAARSIDKPGVTKLRKILGQAEQVKTPMKLAEVNSQFHDVILGYARNSRLHSMLGLFNDVIQRDRNLTAHNMDRRDQIWEEHHQILAALEDGDCDAAEAAMRNHVRMGYEMAKRIFDDETTGHGPELNSGEDLGR